MDSFLPHYVEGGQNETAILVWDLRHKAIILAQVTYFFIGEVFDLLLVVSHLEPSIFYASMATLSSA